MAGRRDDRTSFTYMPCFDLSPGRARGGSLVFGGVPHWRTTRYDSGATLTEAELTGWLRPAISYSAGGTEVTRVVEEINGRAAQSFDYVSGAGATSAAAEVKMLSGAEIDPTRAYTVEMSFRYGGVGGLSATGPNVRALIECPATITSADSSPCGMWIDFGPVDVGQNPGRVNFTMTPNIGGAGGSGAQTNLSSRAFACDLDLRLEVAATRVVRAYVNGEFILQATMGARQANYNGFGWWRRVITTAARCDEAAAYRLRVFQT